MADSNFRGPVNAMGSLEVNAATATVDPLDGPSMFYQGVAMPDSRSAPFAKDGFRPGQQAAFLVGPSLKLADNIPQARSSTQLGVSAVATAATAVSLATTQVAGVASACNIAVGVPIIPVGTTNVTYVIALDFGFTTGTTTANSTTVAVVDNTLFNVGQWLVLGGVGNAAATRSHIAQVQTVATANTTTITILPAAVTGLASIPIGQGNLFGSAFLPPATQFGPAAASASAHSYGGAFAAGLSKVYNPREMLCRNIALQGVTSLAAYSAIVSGWDVWGNPMTELITMTTATSVVGKKAFKYIGSVVPGTTSSQPISYGLGDTFGFPVRVDEWDQTYVTWNNSAQTNNNGFAAAVTTNPATNTTGDVRGTVMISTAILTGSGLSTAVSAVATNGTSRLTISVDCLPWNVVFGTPINPVPMFSVAQSTT